MVSLPAPSRKNSEMLDRVGTDDFYRWYVEASPFLPPAQKPFSRVCYSHPESEQVVVLLRLAMGILLSKDERNLVVIDDRLVNADPVRMRHLCQILEGVATNHCRVVVATCNDTLYAGIPAEVIRVPWDRAEEQGEW